MKSRRFRGHRGISPTTDASGRRDSGFHDDGGDGVFLTVSDGEQDVTGTGLLEDFTGPAVQEQLRLSQTSGLNLQVLPPDPLLPARSQRLERGFLGGESSGKVLELILAGRTVIDFRRREHSLHHGVSTFQRPHDAAHFHDIDPDSDHHFAVLTFPGMFHSTQTRDVCFYRFSELEAIGGFVHAFTSRQTDASIEDASSPEEVAHHKPQLLGALEIPASRVVTLRQIHSARILEPQWCPKAPASPVLLGEGDGILIRKPGLYGVIRSADCLPILAVAGSAKAFCCIHAGWRGTLDRIVLQGVRRLLQKTGGDASSLEVAMGPCVRRCCYPVGNEVRARFEAAGHDLDRIFSGMHLDLVEANRAQLETLGVEKILDCDLCTCCRPELFYSHRRNRDRRRMWMLAGFRE